MVLIMKMGKTYLWNSNQYKYQGVLAYNELPVQPLQVIEVLKMQRRGMIYYNIDYYYNEFYEERSGGGVTWCIN